MLVKIKSYKPNSVCYAWYGDLIGIIVNVREKEKHQQDYVIDDRKVSSSGTIWDCAIHESDVEIIK